MRQQAVFGYRKKLSNRFSAMEKPGMATKNPKQSITYAVPDHLVADIYLRRTLDVIVDVALAISYDFLA